jgi:glycosyltransferase involved in cell wall biosynthesis
MSDSSHLPLVSVIVPVYGVEAYIGQCARSILGQTYPHLECIFVNDGTPDRSMEILSEVVKEFPERNVVVVNKENGGLPRARWSGLEVATGEYIMHVDSDDWLEPDAAARLVEEALRTDADLVYCDFWKEYGSRHKLDHERTYTDQDKAQWMKRLYNNGAYGYVWCKFARKSLYRDMFVPRYNMHEDIVFSTQLIWRASRIAQLSVPLIHYRRTNSSSATRVAKAKRRIQSARNILDLCVNGGSEVAVVRKEIIRKAAWNAFRYDRSLFDEYPFLREESPLILRLLGA